MPSALTDDHHDWIATISGVDPRKFIGGDATPAGDAGDAVPAAAMAQLGASASGEGILDTIREKVTYAATTVENVVGDVWSDIKIGAEAGEQQVEALVDKVEEKATDLVDGVKKALSPSGPTGPVAPKGPITLKSETEVSSPSNRTRTKLGVGERVTLTVTPGPGEWHASGAKLSAKTGNKVTMTAPPRPGNVEVTVDVGGTVATIKFTVIAPSSVVQQVLSTEHLSNGLPNAGFHAQIYLGPDDVNFNAVTFTEDEIGAKASGSWSQKNGEGHSPNPAPLGCTNQVVSGKGTKTAAQDHCWTGYVPGLTLTDWTGEMSWAIPWHWQCGSGKGLIGRATQRVVTTKDGTTTISKAGATFTAAL